MLDILRNVVQGRVCNVFEEQDRALTAFRYVTKKEAIGNVPQYEKLVKKGEVALENFDVNNFVKGHGDYRSKMGIILDTINFDA